MQMKKFNLKPTPDAMLKTCEINLKYINDIQFASDDRTTYWEYNEVIVDDVKRIVPVIKYKIFNKFDFIKTGFSTRFGGVSKNYLGSMNLSFNRGDERENVLLNHELFAKAVGYDYERLVFSDQVHDVNIHVVTEEDAGKGIIKDSDIKGIDGLVTNIENIPLITFFADCVPIYFLDPVKRAVGLAHSGWKGTVNNIASKMVEKMKVEFGTDPSDLVCAIGPSICQDCYEVDDAVIDIVKENFTDEIYKDCVIEKENGKYQLNLHQLCKYNLINAGVLAENIALPDTCTCCNKDFLFSHRASNGKRGNLAAVIMLYNN